MVSGHFYLVGLGALVTADHDKGDTLPLMDSLASRPLDIVEVHEDIFALVTGNEAVTLAGVEPFDCPVFAVVS